MRNSLLEAAVRIHRRVNKRAKQKKEFINLPQANPLVSSDLRSLAIQLDLSGKSFEAQKICRRICDISPEKCEDYLNIAFAQKFLGNSAMASAILQKGITQYPDNQEMYLSYAEFLVEADKCQEALLIYDKAILRFENHCRLFFEKARICYRLLDFEKTKLALISALAAVDTCVDYAIRIGNSFFEFGDFEKAREAYERAIQLDERSAIGHANRGASLLELGKLDEALCSMNKAVKLDKNSAQNFYNRALILSKIGDLESAISDFNHAISLNPSNKFAHYSLSSALFKNGEVKSAISAVEEAIKLDGKYGDAYSNKGVF